MKRLNKQIAAYTQQLRLGEIQMAYKGILAFIGKLRAAFIKKYPPLRCQQHLSGIFGYIESISCLLQEVQKQS